MPGGSDSKESAWNAEHLIPGLGRFPGEGHGNPLQCSCENPHGQWSLVGCSSCGHKESDTTEWLTLSTLWWDSELTVLLALFSQATSFWPQWFLLKNPLTVKLPYDPAIPLLSIYPEETKTEKDTCNPKFIAALFTIARRWKQPRCPLTDDWIKKLWCIYTMEYYSPIKGMPLSQS